MESKHNPVSQSAFSGTLEVEGLTLGEELDGGGLDAVAAESEPLDPEHAVSVRPTTANDMSRNGVRRMGTGTLLLEASPQTVRELASSWSPCLRRPELRGQKCTCRSWRHRRWRPWCRRPPR